MAISLPPTCTALPSRGGIFSVFVLTVQCPSSLDIMRGPPPRAQSVQIASGAPDSNLPATHPWPAPLNGRAGRGAPSCPPPARTRFLCELSLFRPAPQNRSCVPDNWHSHGSTGRTIHTPPAPRRLSQQ